MEFKDEPHEPTEFVLRNLIYRREQLRIRIADAERRIDDALDRLRVQRDIYQQMEAYELDLKKILKDEKGGES